MKAAIVLGSNRNSGKHKELMDRLSANGCEIKFIELSRSKVNSCRVCEKCGTLGRCMQLEDDFNEIHNALQESDTILFVTPIYAPIPSKLVALFKRILSISYFGGKMGGNKKPLLNKRVGVVSYGAGGISCSEAIKLMNQ